jgi:hypothetical protein
MFVILYNIACVVCYMRGVPVPLSYGFLSIHLLLKGRHTLQQRDSRDVATGGTCRLFALLTF